MFEEHGKCTRHDDGSFEVLLPNGATIIQSSMGAKERLDFEMPPALREELDYEALRLDGSMSGLLNEAWRRSAERVLQGEIAAHKTGEELVSIPIVLYCEDVEQISHAADTLGMTRSEVIAAAWALHRDAAAARLSVNGMLY